MSFQVKGKNLTPSERQLSVFCKELRQIKRGIDDISLDKRVKRAKTKAGLDIQLTVRHGDGALKKLGSRIAEIDAEFQKGYAVKRPLLKKKYERLFKQAVRKYTEKASNFYKEPASAEPASGSHQLHRREIHARRATEAIARAQSKIEAAREPKEENEEALTAEGLRPFSKSPNALYALYQICKDAPQQIVQTFMQLPYSLRAKLVTALELVEDDVHLTGRLKAASEELEDGPIGDVAFRLDLLSTDERNLLHAQLENSPEDEHRAFARYIRTFEEVQQELALQVVAKGAEAIETAINGIVDETVEGSGISADEFFDDASITTHQCPSQETLLQHLKQAKEQRGSVFAKFYAEVTAILHKTASDEQRKKAVKALMNELPPAMQQDLYGKIFDLNPQRQPRLGWGERHALDNWKVLLGAAFAYCPVTMKHPLSQLLLDIQKKLHDPKLKNSGEAQKTVKGLLEQAKAKVSEKVWEEFKGKFLKLFPGKEKQKWGPGGEEREAHKHPYHVLSTLQQIVSPFSSAEYWDGMKKTIQELPESSDSSKNPLLQQVRARAKLLPAAIGQELVDAAVITSVTTSTKKLPVAARWQCYNAIEAFHRAEMTGELQKQPFFDRVWRMSPLCRGVYSGREESLDAATRQEMGKRLELLNNLETAKKAVEGRYPIDRDIWDALVLRIILQEEPLNESEMDGMQNLMDGLKDLAEDPTYDPTVAKEIVHLLVDMSSRRLVAEEVSRTMFSKDKMELIAAGRRKELGPAMSAKAVRLEAVNRGLSIKDARLLALSWPLQAKKLDYDGKGRTQFKALLFFKDSEGRILAKLKPLDPCIGNNGKYTVDHFYRELASAKMNDTLGLNITVATTAFRLTLGEGILMLADRYLIAPPIGSQVQDAETMFNVINPLLREAIKKSSPLWDHTSPLQKSSALRDFYAKSGATELLQVIVAKLKQGVSMEEISPIFKWLPANTRNAVYEALYTIKQPKNAPFDYGDKAFHNEMEFSSTIEEKIRAIMAVKEYTFKTGLQPGYPGEGLGALQPWMPDVCEVTEVLIKKDKGGAARLSGLPKERVDSYSISHLLKGHGDSHMGNTLISKTNTLVDCDEEHAITPRSHFDDQIMWEMGLPQSGRPVQPLTLRPMLHPYFQQASEELPTKLLRPAEKRGFMEPYEKQIQQNFKAPLAEITKRAKKLQTIADKAFREKSYPSTRKMFFDLYGGEGDYAKLLKKVPKKRHALLFEQYLGVSAGRVVPLRKNLKEPYHQNVAVLSGSKSK